MNAATHQFSTKALDRAALPDWPRLMAVELAAAYVGIGRTMLEEQGPAPKRIGRRVLYDRHDLDRWADALDGQQLPADDAEKHAREVEARWRERRRGTK
jgi:hypothetical protein